MTSYCHPYRHIVIWSHHPGDLCSCLATMAAAWSTELGIYTHSAQTVRRRTVGPLVTCPPGCEGMEVTGGDWRGTLRRLSSTDLHLHSNTRQTINLVILGNYYHQALTLPPVPAPTNLPLAQRKEAFKVEKIFQNKK